MNSAIAGTETDNKPWVSVTGFRTSVQAYHPIYGLSSYRPRCPVHGAPDCSPLLNGCTGSAGPLTS